MTSLNPEHTPGIECGCKPHRVDETAEGWRSHDLPKVMHLVSMDMAREVPKVAWKMYTYMWVHMHHGCKHGYVHTRVYKRVHPYGYAFTRARVCIYGHHTCVRHEYLSPCVHICVYICTMHTCECKCARVCAPIMMSPLLPQEKVSFCIDLGSLGATEKDGTRS